MRGSNSKTYCGSCSEVLIGEAIKVAANLHYHVQCFLCTECGCELVNTGFFSKLAKYYCAEDYHSLFGTLCNLCHKYIEGEGLSIQGKGKSYHISCLTCTKCGDRFDEGSRITFESEQALCDSCKVNSLKTPAVKHMCAACSKVIVGTSIFAMEQEWHMECFICQECKGPLTGEYMCKDGLPYCEEDYQNLFGQCCNICSDFILGKVLQAGGNSYHTECLKCYICTQQFEEGQEIFMQDELFWHTDCDEITKPEVKEEEKVTPQPEPLHEVEEEEAEAEIAEKKEEVPVSIIPEKAAPQLIIPPPPLTTPPPDTPVSTRSTPSPVRETPHSPVRDIASSPETQQTDKLDTLDVETVSRDRVSTGAASYTSDYEDLTVLMEENREVVYDADFDEAEPAKEEASGETEVLKEMDVVIDHVKEEPVVESEPNDFTHNIETASPEIATPETASPEIASPQVPEAKISVEQPDITLTLPSVVETGETVKVNGIKTSDESDDEKPLSVKDLLKLAKEKENDQEVEPSAFLPRKTSRAETSISQSLLSTASETTSDRGSVKSDVPSKPVRSRSKSPASNTPRRRFVSPPREVIKCEQVRPAESKEETAVSPSAAIRGLRQVDSPVLKLLDDLDKKEEQIDYLDLQDTYDLKVLRTEKFRLPKGIDRSQLQQYLTADQFLTAFKMDQDKFNRLPLWKKNNLKKSLDLF